MHALRTSIFQPGLLGTALALAIAAACHGAEIIPADRRMAWAPGTVTGVPGGIPNRTTIFVNVKTTANAAYKCLGNGTTDDSAALKKALDDCPDGQVVYMPAGTYRLNSSVRTLNSQLTLRGAGQGQTIIKPYQVSGLGGLYLGSSDWPVPSTGPLITAGATAGSTTVTVGTTAAVNVGALMRIDPANPSWVHNLNTADNNPTMTFTFKVVSKTATTVTFTPALPMDLSSRSPRLVPYSTALMEGVGVEDLTLDLNDSPGLASSIYMEQAWGCWFRNLEVANSDHRQFFLNVVSASEIRHCYTHATKSGGPGHEGIDLYAQSCWNLIEDNIVYDGGFPGIILGDSQGGCQGNVIAFNYCAAVDVGAADTGGADISFSHGPHNVLNLAEGNVVSMIQADGYFGSSSHNTIFRNWCTVTHPTATEGLRAIDLTHFQDYYNVVGNVLGTPAFPASPNGLYVTETRYFNNGIHLIYRLGFPNMGNTGYGDGTDGLTFGPTTPPNYAGVPFTLANAQALDLNVKNTLLRHGNYDYANRAVVWDAAISEHTIPASLFRTAKPAWFGNRAWPPVDPGSPGACAVDSIPAGYRFVHGTEPPAGGANQAPVSAAQGVSTAEDTAKAITLAATDADGDALSYSIVTGPAHGSLSGSGSALTYTPAGGYAGSDAFTFKANDGSADSNTATVSITVTANGGTGSRPSHAGGGGGGCGLGGGMGMLGLILAFRPRRRR